MCISIANTYNLLVESFCRLKTRRIRTALQMFMYSDCALFYYYYCTPWMVTKQFLNPLWQMLGVLACWVANDIDNLALSNAIRQRCPELAVGVIYKFILLLFLSLSFIFTRSMLSAVCAYLFLLTFEICISNKLMFMAFRFGNNYILVCIVYLVCYCEFDFQKHLYYCFYLFESSDVTYIM